MCVTPKHKTTIRLNAFPLPNPNQDLLLMISSISGRSNSRPPTTSSSLFSSFTITSSSFPGPCFTTGTFLFFQLRLTARPHPHSLLPLFRGPQRRFQLLPPPPPLLFSP